MRCSTPGQGLAGVDVRPRALPVRDAQKPLRDHPFSPVQAGQEHAVGAGDCRRHDRAVGQLEVQRGLDQFPRHVHQLGGQRHKLFDRQPAVSVVHRFAQRVADSSPHPDHCRLLDAELHGDRIGGLEPDAANVPRKPVRVVAHHLDGIDAVGLVDAHRPRRADAVGVQKYHDLANDLLLRPGVGDAPGAHAANAGHLAQPLRLGLDDVEDLVAERRDQFLRIDRPDAMDHAGAEVFLDTLGRGRRRGAHETRLELLAMGALVDPLPRHRHPLSGRDDGGMADHRHQIAMAPSLDPQDAKAVVGVMEGDALDKTDQDFLDRRFRLWLGLAVTAHDVPSCFSGLC